MLLSPSKRALIRQSSDQKGISVASRKCGSDPREFPTSTFPCKRRASYGGRHSFHLAVLYRDTLFLYLSLSNYRHEVAEVRWSYSGGLLLCGSAGDKFCWRRSMMIFIVFLLVLSVSLSIHLSKR